MSTVEILSASSLIGDGVVNPEGDDLGKVEEIMIDTPTGNVAYAVLSFGGFLGLGDKYFAIPWQRLQLDADNKRLILNVDKQALENAPGFDKDDWPNVDMNYVTSVYSHYGVQPYWNR